MKLKIKSPVFSPFFFLLLLLMAACAVQQTPTGGERDIEPPKLISVNPQNESVNFKAKEISILFNEYVQLKNAFQEISIFPEPEVRPEFRTRREELIILFRDTLLSNTTYQINFGKSIGDMNEGNPFPNFKYIFSTGNQIDSLRISGRVDRYSLRPPQRRSSQNQGSDIVVLLHPEQDTIANQDSLVMMKKAPYYTYADSSGRFELTNLKEGRYRVFALFEENASRIYDEPEELIGFLQEPLQLKGDTVLDPFYLAPLEQTSLEILDDRSSGPRVTLLLNKKPEDLDVQVIFPENFKNKLLVEQDEKSDSVTVWLPSINYDSLSLAVGENQVYDTLLFRSYDKEKKLPLFTISDNLERDVLKPGQSLELNFSRPLNSLNMSRIEILEDSTRVSSSQIKAVKLNERRYRLEYPWKMKSGYQLTIGQEYLLDRYESGNTAYQRRFIADSLENYGNILISYALPDSVPDSLQYLVQLMDADYRVIREDVISRSQKIGYRTLTPGRYIIRVIYDRNRNARWDGTYLFEKVQPERLLIFDPGENLRANWDQEYNIEIPPDEAPE